MVNRLLAVVTVCVVAFGAACCGTNGGGEDAPPPGISVPSRVKSDLGDDVVRVLLNAEPLELVSVHPSPKTRDAAEYAKLGIDGNALIYDYAILGKHAMTPMEKGAILGAFFKGMDADEGTRAACFNPRHALVGEFGGKRVEVLICFECLSFNLYVDGKLITAKLGATRSPEKAFNDMLDKHGVKRPGK